MMNKPKRIQPDSDQLEMLEIAETTGVKNLERRHTNADQLKSQALSHLTILITGIAGALAYGFRLLEGDIRPINWGAALLCLYWMVLASWLMLKVITAKDYPSIYYQPGHLLTNDISVEDYRRGYVAYLDRAVNEAVAINSQMAHNLNAIRWLTVASPLVFIIGWAAKRVPV